MSYDYMLVKGKAGGGLEALAESAMSETIGAAADVKASISRLFPAVRWGTGPNLPGSQACPAGSDREVQRSFSLW